MMDFSVIRVVSVDTAPETKAFESMISPADVCGGFAVNKCE